MKFMSGTAEHQLDAKNRIRIPAKFRSAFPEHETLYFVRYNPDRIAVMSEEILNEKFSVFGNTTPDDEEAMNAMTKILASIDEISEDTQGRTMIPRAFREAANIKKDVITVGMGNYIEIWAKEIYDEKIGALSFGKASKIAFGKAKGKTE